MLRAFVVVAARLVQRRTHGEDARLDPHHIQRRARGQLYGKLGLRVGRRRLHNEGKTEGHRLPRDQI